MLNNEPRDWGGLRAAGGGQNKEETGEMRKKGKRKKSGVALPNTGGLPGKKGWVQQNGNSDMIGGKLGITAALEDNV